MFILVGQVFILDLSCVFKTKKGTIERVRECFGKQGKKDHGGTWNGVGGTGSGSDPTLGEFTRRHRGP